MFIKIASGQKGWTGRPRAQASSRRSDLIAMRHVIKRPRTLMRGKEARLVLRLIWLRLIWRRLAWCRLLSRGEGQAMHLPPRRELVPGGNALRLLQSHLRVTPYFQHDLKRIPLVQGVIYVSCGAAQQRRSQAADMPPTCQRTYRAPQ